MDLPGEIGLVAIAAAADGRRVPALFDRRGIGARGRHCDFHVVLAADLEFGNGEDEARRNCQQDHERSDGDAEDSYPAHGQTPWACGTVILVTPIQYHRTL